MIKFCLGVLFGLVIGAAVGRDDTRNWLVSQFATKSAVASSAIADAVKK